MDLVFAPAAVLLAAAVLEIVLARVLSRAAKGWLACLAAAIATLPVAAMAARVLRGDVLTATWLVWDAGIPVSYRIDGLSVLFMLIATGIGAAILLYAVRYMEHEEEGVTRFYVLMLVFIAGLVVLVCSVNLLVAYVAWEVVGLCSYFLVGFWYKQDAGPTGARKVLVITHLAGYGLFAAILLLYVRTGSFLWTDAGPAFSTGIALLMLVAAMGKSVLFPLHTWIPEAMNAPTPVSALLHSACYVKAGVYLIARMYSIGPWHAALGNLLLLVGCLTMLIGAVFAVAQTDLKRLLAFSTVSQLGYIVTGLALGTDLGAAAGLYYTASHALFKGTLFLCAGAVQHATGTRDLRKLGGLSAWMPVTTAVWLVAAAAIAGVPFTTGFVAKWLLFDAALEAKQVLVVFVAWAVSLVTVFYFLKATVSVFFGTGAPEVRAERIHEVALSMRLGMGVLGALCVVFGVAPQVLMRFVVEPAVRALGFTWQVQMTWFGVVTGSGAVGVTAGAAAVVAGVVLGAAAFGFARAPVRTPVMVFTGGDPLPEDETLGAVDFTEIAEAAFAPVYALDPDPLYLRIWLGVRDVAASTGELAVRVFEEHPMPTVVAGAAILCAGVWLL
jgi:multicomponent Na+:H+ antiporter subunit A